MAYGDSGRDVCRRPTLLRKASEECFPPKQSELHQVEAAFGSIRGIDFDQALWLGKDCRQPT